jgi:hypothetical protein
VIRHSARLPSQNIRESSVDASHDANLRLFKSSADQVIVPGAPFLAKSPPSLVIERPIPRQLKAGAFRTRFSADRPRLHYQR